MHAIAMPRFLLSVVCVLFAWVGSLTGAPSADVSSASTAKKVYRVVVIPVRTEINDPTLFVLRRGLKEAIANGIDAVVVDMNTPGGSAAAALEMMEGLDKFPGTTITFVNNEAVSAGAFIAASTQEIWFAPKSVIGAAAAVTSQGQDIPETMRLKLNSFLKAKVRAVSEGRGYRGQVVSAMIDKDDELKIDDKVIKKSGALLSLTAEEAMATYGNPPQPLLGAGVAKDIDELLTKKYGAGNYTLNSLRVTWSEQLAQYLAKISPILLGLGMVALFIEFKTPGFGAFGIAGIVLIAVVFLSSYVAGLSGHEPALVFALGLALLAAEIFFFPGVVAPALLGVVLMLGSLVWALADLWPNEPLTLSGGALIKPLGDVGLGLVIAVALGAVAVRFLPRSWLWDRVVLSSAVGTSAQVAGVAPESVAEADSLIGQQGTVITPLRPFGQVEIQGKRYEARLMFGSADAGAKIVVTGRAEFGLSVEVVT